MKSTQGKKPTGGKTRKMRYPRGEIHTYDKSGFCCEATFHSLHKWYEAEFEKLGWMILAKSRNMKDKIHTYLNSLSRLHEALTHKLSHLRDSDKQEDIMIMIANVDILMKHAIKDLK